MYDYLGELFLYEILFVEVVGVGGESILFVNDFEVDAVIFYF